ncbi:MAG: ABC transporter ATP-binding protein [Streptomyces sp.]|nr:ABC transporter ATP-binding protein [Streptomyces sp.]
MRRGATGRLPAEEAGATSERELFGSRLRVEHGMLRHDGAAERLGFAGMARRLPRLFVQTMGLALRVDRGALLLFLGAEAAQGIASAYILLSVNAVLGAALHLGITWDTLGRLVFPLVGISTAATLVAVLKAASFGATGRLQPKIERSAGSELLRRVSRVELQAFEDPAFRAVVESAHPGTLAAGRMIQSTSAITNSAVSLVAMSGVLTALHPLLLPLLLLIVVPKGWGAVLNARRAYRSMHAQAEHVRQEQVLARLLTEHQAAPEIRVHGAGRHLLRHHEAIAAGAEAELSRLAGQAARTQVLTSAVTGVTTLLAYAALVSMQDAHRTAVAGFATALLAIRLGTAGLQRLVTGMDQLYEQSLFFGDWVEACREAERMAIPDRGEPLPQTVVTLELSGVGYTYRGRPEPAVRDVDLTIRPGEVVALVGENGSGKTTLAKVVAGLYLPQRGTVRWGGVDVTEADRFAVFDRVALLGQDFKRWPFTARSNITVSEFGKAHDAEAVARAVAYADAETFLASLPAGSETLLDRSFRGGVEVSGGQWQRIALARARFRDFDLLICDEPTSALDPASEIEAYQKIRGLADAGKSVLLITHRLASVRSADRVVVLERGRVIDTGTPDELLNRPGKFRDLYVLQASQFGSAADRMADA